MNADTLETVHSFSDSLSPQTISDTDVVGWRIPASRPSELVIRTPDEPGRVIALSNNYLSNKVAFVREGTISIESGYSPIQLVRTVRSGVLEIEIQADSVNAGSGLRNNKLKSKDFFDVKDSPTIAFKSTKVVQTGPNTFDLEGDFTIRGVTKTEKLTLTDNGKGSTSGSIDGTMAFDRKDYGMNKNIPFVKIANRVEVNVSLKWKRVSGAPPVFQQ